MFRHPHLFCSAAPGGGGYATEKRISQNDGRESDSLRFAAGDNTWDLARKYAEHPHPPLPILVHVGTRGFNYQNNLEYMEFLNSLKIPHQRLIVPEAPHSARVIYEKRGLEIMKFHAENFRYAGPRTDRPTADRREKSPPVPSAVDRKLTDLEYARVGERSLKLDLYLPPGGDQPPALVVWIHGGAWRAGSKNRCPIVWLTAHGYAVASLDFRLTGEARFPALLHDCKAALRWLRAHADELGCDAQRIGVAGGSSGGHLAALVGVTGGVRELEGDLGAHREQSSRVQAVVDMYGMTDLYYNATVERERCDLPACPLYQLLGGKPSQHLAAARLASPVFHVTKDDPPLLILHGAEDRSLVRPFQGRFLRDRCVALGLDAKMRIIEGAGHGGPEFSDATRRALILDLFDRHVKKK